MMCWLFCLLCMQKRCVGCTVYCECRNVVLAVLFIVHAETLCWLYCLLCMQKRCVGCTVYCACRNLRADEQSAFKVRATTWENVATVQPPIILYFKTVHSGHFLTHLRILLLSPHLRFSPPNCPFLSCFPVKCGINSSRVHMC
jgi:hypothetical protein